MCGWPESVSRWRAGSSITKPLPSTASSSSSGGAAGRGRTTTAVVSESMSPATKMVSWKVSVVVACTVGATKLAVAVVAPCSATVGSPAVCCQR